MRYRSLGKTEVSVSEIGFGASPLGNVFGTVTDQDVETSVAFAIDHRVNLFDVSPYYGRTVAEARLGDALHGRRDRVLLGTKCGRYGADNFDFSAKTITLEVENSLRRLRTDYLDLLQAHDIEFGNIDDISNETIPAMRRLQEQGKVRFVGITGYWPALLARVAGRVDVDTILNYCHFNLFIDDMDRDLTPLATSSGVALLNASPLHMGLLSDQPVPEWHPAPLAVKVAANDVIALCRQANVNPATLALWHCLQHPTACSTFVGMCTVDQVKRNLEALTLDPDPTLLAAIHERLRAVNNIVWPSGRPENQDQPQPPM